MKKEFLTLLVFLCTTLFVHAQLPPVRTYYYDDYKNKQGVCERWDEDANGLKHGKYIRYFKDGDRAELGYYEHGKATGTWTVETRQTVSHLLEIINYANNSRNGEYKKYVKGVLYCNGKDFSQCNYPSYHFEHGFYSNGEKTGQWQEFYNVNTKVYQTGNYLENKRIGKWLNTRHSKDDWRPSTEKGYITYYSDKGDINKCLDANGVDIQETKDFDNIKGLSGCNTFISKYPYSKYLDKVYALKSGFMKEKNKLIEAGTIDYVEKQLRSFGAFKIRDTLDYFVDNFKSSPKHQEFQEMLQQLNFYHQELKKTNDEVLSVLAMLEHFPEGNLAVRAEEKILTLKPSKNLKTEFNLDSYIMTKETEEDIINLCEKINNWNNRVSLKDKISVISVRVEAKMADDKDSKNRKIQKEMFDILAINRSFIVSKFLKEHLSEDVNIYSFPVQSKSKDVFNSYIELNTSKTELSEQMNLAQELVASYNLNVTNVGYLGQGIITNEALRENILNSLKAYSLYGQLQRIIPLELFYSEGRNGLGQEMDLPKFKLKMQKIADKSKYKMDIKEYVCKSK